MSDEDDHEGVHDSAHSHHHHHHDDEDDGEPASTGGLPMMIAVGIFIIGLFVLGIVPSCT